MRLFNILGFKKNNINKVIKFNINIIIKNFLKNQKNYLSFEN